LRVISRETRPCHFELVSRGVVLKHGADPNARASLRKRVHPGYSPKHDVENTYEYRNITPLAWGRRFHAKVFVSEPAMKLIEAAAGSSELIAAASFFSSSSYQHRHESVTRLMQSDQ
jgi:hypothetical protein